MRSLRFAFRLEARFRTDTDLARVYCPEAAAFQALPGCSEVSLRSKSGKLCCWMDVSRGHLSPKFLLPFISSGRSQICSPPIPAPCLTLLSFHQPV